MNEMILGGLMPGAKTSRTGVARDAARSLRLRGIGESFGGVAAIRDIDLDVAPGEIRAIIGPNGAGKSTLLNVISGLYGADSGTIVVAGAEGRRLRARHLARLGICRTFQNLALFEGLDVEQNVALGRTAHRRASTLERLVGFGRIRRERAETRDAVASVLTFLDLQHVRHLEVGGLPYGVRKRVELARAIVGEPGILLLDEPMAGMGRAEKRVLADFIRATRDTYGTTVLLIEHDIGVVMRLADRITVLDHGVKIAEGTPTEVREDRAVIDAYLGAELDTEIAA